MRSIAVIPGKADSISLKEVKMPEPSENEILLRVEKVGICGTDRDIIKGIYGEAPLGSDYLIIGHESLCRVEEADANGEFSKGELVVPTVRRSCSENCLACRMGMSDMCFTGSYKEHGIKGLHGFAREFATTDSSYVVKLPDSLSEVGVLLEPLSIAEKGVTQALNLYKSRLPLEPEKLLVLGAGPVGILATALLRLKGYEVDTVATRSNDSLKAKLVNLTGADYIDSNSTPISSLQEKYDIVFELTGNTNVAFEAHKIAKKNGIVAFLGIYSSMTASEDFGKIFTDIVLTNSLQFGSVNANKRYFVEGVKDMIEMQKKWPSLLKSMLTGIFKPEDYKQAYYRKGSDDIKSIIAFH